MNNNEFNHNYPQELAEQNNFVVFRLEKGKDNKVKKVPYSPHTTKKCSVPNVEMTSFIFRETIMSHLLLWGNGYAQIVRDNAGRVKYLYPLLPNKMDVSRDDNGEIFYTYYRNHDEKHSNKKDGGITLKREDVLHIAGLGFDGLVGYSPIALAKNAIGMSIAAENYGATFFANGGNPSGILEHAEGLGEKAPNIRDTWESIYRGSGNHRIAVLEDGLKFKPISIPPDQAQFLETRKYQLGEIARIFGVPPHMIGDLERATFSNIEHQSIEFVTRTINPWVKRIEQCMDLALLTPIERKTYAIRFNLDAMLRGDYKTRMEGYKIGRQNGWLSANDIRENGGGSVGVTAASETDITFDDIIDLFYSLKPPYRSKAVFLTNDTAMKQLRKVKDANGQYIWTPSVVAGTPDMILGRPVYTSPFVPEIAVGSLPLAFGDFNFYWIADKRDIRFKVLNELYAERDQIGFHATERIDGKMILSEAVKLLQMST